MVVIILGLILIVLFKLHKYTKNPYKLEFVVGGKGSGKSLLLARKATKHKGFVYSNMDVGIPLNEEYWLDEYPPNSLIMLDEAGLEHNNRNFKSFSKEATAWYKYQRKNKLHVVLTSQSLDIDKKIRDLLDSLVIVRRMSSIFDFIYYGKRYKNVVTMVEKQDGGQELGNSEKPAGLAFIYTIPKSVYITDYDTLQKVKLKVKK